MNVKLLLSGKLLKSLMRFFTSLRYVQNDNTLSLDEWGLVPASPPPSPISLKTM